MTNGSKTAENQRKMPKGKPFVKGDPRINRKGRPPVNSEELNALLDEIFAEEISDDRGNKMAKLRVALNKMLLGKNIAGAIHLLERRYGKIPQAIDLSNTDGSLKPDALSDEERLARMKALAQIIAEEVKKDA